MRKEADPRRVLLAAQEESMTKEECLACEHPRLKTMPGAKPEW